MSEPRLTSFASRLTLAMPLSIQRPGIGVPGNSGGHNRRTRAVFLCAQHGQPVMGGPCGGALGHAGPESGTPTLHGSPTLIGVRASGNYTATQELQP